MSSRTDAELAQATLEGSEEAFGELVDRYRRPLFSLIVRMVREGTIAEDLCQETFVKAYEKLPSLEAPDKFRSWLFAIAANRMRDRQPEFYTQFVIVFTVAGRASGSVSSPTFGAEFGVQMT